MIKTTHWPQQEEVSDLVMHRCGVGRFRNSNSEVLLMTICRTFRRRRVPWFVFVEDHSLRPKRLGETKDLLLYTHNVSFVTQPGRGLSRGRRLSCDRRAWHSNLGTGHVIHAPYLSACLPSLIHTTPFSLYSSCLWHSFNLLLGISS